MGKRDDWRATISDYSPIQTTEPVPVVFHDLAGMLQLFDMVRMITDKDGGKLLFSTEIFPTDFCF